MVAAMAAFFRCQGFHSCLLRQKMMARLSVGAAMVVGATASMVMVGEEKD